MLLLLSGPHRSRFGVLTTHRTITYIDFERSHLPRSRCYLVPHIRCLFTLISPTGPTALIHRFHSPAVLPITTYRVVTYTTTCTPAHATRLPLHLPHYYYLHTRHHTAPYTITTPTLPRLPTPRSRYAHLRYILHHHHTYTPRAFPYTPTLRYCGRTTTRYVLFTLRLFTFSDGTRLLLF